MTKYFCDCCGAEMTDKNKPEGGVLSGGRLGAKLKGEDGVMTVEVVTSWNGTANAGIFCKYCILDALQQFDDRAKPAEAKVVPMPLKTR